ncbi:MAG: hypothetical protein NWE94_06110 [Candidatus Bathyarchaeota archaeon]|nr:hypothetical protein [Candidatus Bathyarchaeota archaeon]
MSIRQRSGATTGKKIVLYEDLDGTTYDVDLPLTNTANPAEFKEALEIPAYVDLDYFPMKSAMVTLWAALNAPKLHEQYPAAFDKKISDKPIPALLFGGAAVKIHCQSANSTGKLTRAIKDTDFIVPKKQGIHFYKLLLGMAKAFGTMYTSFATANDRRFNTWRYGNRYRLTTINGITTDGLPMITVLDLFCDEINLRHNIKIKDMNLFEHYKENLYTIGLEAMLLSKGQFIFDMPKETAEELKQKKQEYRILNYPHFPKDRIIIGMEEKDLRDVAAIFLDHDLGKGKEKIDPQLIRKAFDKDKKLALTVTLNLKNLAERPEILAKWLPRNEATAVADKIETLLKETPKIDGKWDKPWWNTEVETPTIQ